jgi:hypothetical protein
MCDNKIKIIYVNVNVHCADKEMTKNGCLKCDGNKLAKKMKKKEENCSR